MSRLGPKGVGAFLLQQEGELTRIWRMARAAARPEVFPGLLDGVVGPFFARAGEELARGGAPGAVWEGLAGVVRWAITRGEEELREEWVVVREVVGAACEAVNADPAVQAWLGEASARCQQGALALCQGGTHPPGLVPAVVFSSLVPRPAARG